MQPLPSVLAGQPTLGNVQEVVFQSHIVLTFSVAGQEALPVWQQLTEQHGDTGLWPVITGPRPFAPSRVTPVSFAGNLQGPDLIAHWLVGEQEDPELVTEIGPLVLSLEEAQQHAGSVAQDALVPASWQEGVVSNQDWRTRQPYPQVFLALVPTQATWDAPTWLGFGRFNGCPLPAEHHAVLKYWHDQYSLQVMCVTEDMVECRVERPPTEAAQALVLATEQFAYCPDLVHQGCGSVTELAGGLLRSPTWSFWWD
ncbi:DUF4253 domain-containing protein [Deinococcus arcticus]|uniref:DUF4253 domain-containing protein n=1 Tax=Deinococcus arcticus TaxID=2136176 RepID=A0A2T3W8K7_9DEIO|nr:DUF4253 domain-containing protein [Deinococcus arcticus]PTA68222.1 hypothetical protein C8263_09190 [Deinococcus arcticus]